MYLDGQGNPALDVARYLKEQGGEEKPDVVTFLLGINDCFGAKPENPDATIDTMFTNAEKLIAAFRVASPRTVIAIGLTTAPNSREGAFQANYKGKYPRWGWKRIQHRLVQRQLAQFGGREKDGIYVVPTELNVDPVEGYPADNAVHPNAAGYARSAAVSTAGSSIGCLGPSDRRGSLRICLSATGGLCIIAGWRSLWLFGCSVFRPSPWC
nr:SGNH/GDSL hydrolase family protein [Verrucomicrobium spinosum]